jgi:flagellin
MGLRIQNNIEAMNAHRQLTISNNAMGKSLERLSSGFRINRAADDAAGLAVSMGMRADIASYKVASRNASEANSLLQVAEGAFDQISNILTRMKELTTQGTSANASGNGPDIVKEVASLKLEITRIAESTEYAGTTLLGGYGASLDLTNSTLAYASAVNMDTAHILKVSGNGVSSGATYAITQALNAVTITNGAATETVNLTQDGAQTITFASQGVSIQTSAAFSRAAGSLVGNIKFAVNGGTFIIGNQDTDSSKITVDIDKVSLADLGINSVNGTTLSDLDTINNAIKTLASSRAGIGATMNRLGYATANLATTIENTQAAESVIRDVDMASEMTTFTKTQILMQAGTAMLGQANMAPQNILSLLK